MHSEKNGEPSAASRGRGLGAGPLPRHRAQSLSRAVHQSSAASLPISMTNAAATAAAAMIWRFMRSSEVGTSVRCCAPHYCGRSAPVWTIPAIFVTIRAHFLCAGTCGWRTTCLTPGCPAMRVESTALGRGTCRLPDPHRTMPGPRPLIAATSTRAMLCVAQQRGAVVADLLAAVGLDSTQLDDPDARLPAPAVLSLWSALRERTGDPALQLAAPAALPWGAYRVIDYLVAASQTVGEGIDRFVRFFGLIANTVTLTIEESDGYAVRLAGTSGGAVVPVYVDYVFAALVTRIRMKVRPELEVHKVELRQHAPDNAEAYRALFRAPVHFGAAEDRLCFTPEEWQ